MITSKIADAGSLKGLLESAQTPEDLTALETWLNELDPTDVDETEPEADDECEEESEDDAPTSQNAHALRYELKTSEAIRDIGPPPEVSDPELRELVASNLEEFLTWLFPQVFKWPFSPDQRHSLDRMDYIVNHGGLQVIADPRGTGKTQRALRVALKAILTGKRKYVCLVAATDRKAKSLIKAVRTILGYNSDLYRLFPNEVHGFPQLRGTNKKAPGQICCGTETAIHFGADKIIFPTIPGSVASGAVISSCGITGDVRGQFHTLQDGTVIRPDLILIDDPQTKESAKSSEQTQDRLEIIEGDILGMAAPDTAMACVALVTVIEKDDLSERLLNLPKWHGERTKTINVMPTNMKAWDKYFEDVAEAERTKEPEKINAAYLANRSELDEGCEVSWEHKKETNDVSAIQSAMHLLYRCGPAAFAAEYQNEPLDSRTSDDQPEFSGIAIKLTLLDRLIVPVWATKVTMGVDVQQSVLLWKIVAWADDFTPSIIGYGAWPEQARSYFTVADANPTLQEVSGLSQLEGILQWGLDGLTKKFLGRGLPKEGGGQISIGKCVIDANWGKSTDIVYEFCRRSTFGGIVIPSHGRGIKAGDKPMSEWAKKKLETHGWHWVITPGDGRRAITHVIFDTNHWKTTMAERAAAAAGERGGLSIFGTKPEQHRLLIDHLAAETPVKTSGRGRELWEWRAKPGADNHWLDCLSLCGVGASILGCKLEGTLDVSQRTRKRYTAEEIRKLQEARSRA